jgi:uncharacterized protein (AIM24 family)
LPVPPTALKRRHTNRRVIHAALKPWQHHRSAGVADDIDFEIKGQELQFVEIELDPGESAVAEAGALVWKDASVGMERCSATARQRKAAAHGQARRRRKGSTGESLFTTVFTHEGSGKARVAFASPVPGAILPIRLGDLGGRLICQKDAFLAAAKGVSIGIEFQRRMMTGLFGGEGFIMQKLEGDGWVFVQMGGAVVERELGPGEQLHVDTAALLPTRPRSISISWRPAASRAWCSEGRACSSPGSPDRAKVWIQSLPFSRLAGRMLQAAMPYGGQSRGEGSVLGPLGDLIGGNR